MNILSIITSRRFSTLNTLRTLQSQRESLHMQEANQLEQSLKAMSEYKEDLDFDGDLTLKQKERAELMAKYLAQLTPVEMRTMFSVYRQYFIKLNPPPNHDDQVGEQGYWRANHPRNLEFQEKFQIKGLLGLHGMFKEVSEKVESGEAFNALKTE